MVYLGLPFEPWLETNLHVTTQRRKAFAVVPQSKCMCGSFTEFAAFMFKQLNKGRDGGQDSVDKHFEHFE